MEGYILADDFIETRVDCTEGILKAIREAKKQGIKEVRFSRGVYQLKGFTVLNTLSAAHDDGCGDIREKECHLLLEGIKNLTLRGEISASGEPDTVITGCHEPLENGIAQTQFLLPSIIWAKRCSNLTIKNLAFSREPETASAGVVKGISNGRIEVEVYQGLPCYDQMGAYCMNRLDGDTGALSSASLTYGFGYEERFQKTGDRTLILEDLQISSQLQPGDRISWHQSGRTDFQLFFGSCLNLQFDNIRIYNTNSFGILTENCRDINAQALVMKPRGNQLFTGPRDGWKIYRCTGKIKLDHCHIEGVRMDGQNIHSNFLIMENKIDDKTMVVNCKYAPIPLEEGSKVVFYLESGEKELTLVSWRIAGAFYETGRQSEDETSGAAHVGKENRITKYRLEFEQEIPKEVRPGVLLDALCWLPERYECYNSTFQNIAGAGHLIRCGHVTIKNCKYVNMMNAGILIGAELDTHRESSHGAYITIEGCEFINCGFKPRYGEFGMGGIAVKSQGFHHRCNHDIDIIHNQFIHCSQGIEIRDAKNVTLEENEFIEVVQKLLSEPIS